jgi:hypothetical protein
MLAAYGVAAAYVFGMLMNLWSWPYTLGAGTSLSFVPGAPALSNLHRFLVFSVTTSALGWDTGRAVTNSVAIVVLGPAVLATLRRAARRASFGALATYGPDVADVADVADAANAPDVAEAAEAESVVGAADGSAGFAQPAHSPPARQGPCGVVRDACAAGAGRRCAWPSRSSAPARVARPPRPPR